MAKTATAKFKVAPASSTKKITFSVNFPGAREVIMTGDFTAWARDRIRLTAAANNQWSTTLELKPGEYQYRLLVDGQWKDNPTATKRVPNSYGSQNCVLIVS